METVDIKKSRLIKGDGNLKQLTVPQLDIDVGVEELNVEKKKFEKLTIPYIVSGKNLIFPPKEKAKQVVLLPKTKNVTCPSFSKSANIDSEITIIKKVNKYTLNIKGENNFKRTYYENVTIDHNQLRGAKINKVGKEIKGELIKIIFAEKSVSVLFLVKSLNISLNNTKIVNDRVYKLNYGSNILQIEKKNFEFFVENL